MATFDELLTADATGVVWLLEVSFNDFATVSYRWATASHREGGFDYDGRITSITPITRSFGRGHLPAASTTRLRLDNSDFGVDWLIERATVATQLLQARFRLTACAYQSNTDTASSGITTATQTIGVFCCLDQPEMLDTAVDLTLADDSVGRLAEPLTTPTVRDWKDNPATLQSDRPVNPFNNNGPQPAMDWDVPLPLVFGMGETGVNVPAYAAVAQYAGATGPIFTEDAMFGGGDFDGGEFPTVLFPIIVCATKANTSSKTNEITKLYGTYRADVEGKPAFRGVTIDIPRRVVLSERNNFEVEIWTPRRSPVITKSGREWQIVWIDFNVDMFAAWFHRNWDEQRLTESGGQVPNLSGSFNGIPVVPATAVSSPTISSICDMTNRGDVMAAFESFTCDGSPLSVVTTASASGRVGPALELVNHIYDLVAYYSKATAADIDTASFNRAAKARTTVFGAGIIQPARPRPLKVQNKNGWLSPNPRDGVVGILRTALGEMCASCDVDFFMTKEGLYALSTNVFDYDAVTEERVSIDEARSSRVRVRIPSAGERWAPYNRVFVNGPGGSYGPYDNQDAIDEWGNIQPITIEGKWNARLFAENAAAGASGAWEYRTLESVVRPAIRFTADRELLALELGDYFEFTYTRGGLNTVFDAEIFRLESMRISPTTLGVELEGIWADDLSTDNPFLLDDEDFVELVASAGGRTATVTDSSTTVTFSSGDLVSDGVEAGDILELLDATQADDVFTRYRRLRVNFVFSPTSLIVTDSDLDFDAGAPTAVATWRILKGATTYPTSGDDPVNYPSGSAMYGKACDADFEFSDDTTANKLMDG